MKIFKFIKVLGRNIYLRIAIARLKRQAAKLQLDLDCMRELASFPVEFDINSRNFHLFQK